MTKKLSEIILEMMEPYRHIYRQKHVRAETLVALAAMAWNKTLLSEKVAEKISADFLKTVADDETRAISATIINQFVQYKQKNYGNDRRYIINYKVETGGNSITLHIEAGTIDDDKYAAGKMKPQRNSPCLCGSGKKYKMCCGNDYLKLN